MRFALLTASYVFPAEGKNGKGDYDDCGAIVGATEKAASSSFLFAWLCLLVGCDGRGMRSRQLVQIPSQIPLVVALVGLPGCGKSTIARTLVAELGLHEVNRDRIRAALFPSCTFSDEEKQAAVNAAFDAVAVNCGLGRSSVVDGMPFSRRAEIEALRAQTEEAGGRVVVLYVDCPAEEARRRLAGDAEHPGTDHPAGDRTPALVDEVAARFEPPPADAVRIDATEPPGRMAGAAVAVVVGCLRDPGGARRS